MEVLQYVFGIWLSIQIGLVILGFGFMGVTIKENKDALENYTPFQQKVIYTIPWLVDKIWG